MKENLTSLDVHHLVRDFQRLVGSRLAKVYQGPKERKRDLLFQFHRQGEKPLVRILLPGYAYIAEEKPAVDQAPGDFAMFLRKHVGNARVVAVRQRGFDRILEFELENKNGKFVLLFELLPPGNALLLNAQGKIVNLLEPKRMGQRLVRGGAIYEPPPAQFDTASATDDEIASRLLESNKELVKAIAIDLGLGGEYAEEACARSGSDKHAKGLAKKEMLLIAGAIKDLFSPGTACGSEKEVFPFQLTSKSCPETFPSFSRAIEQLLPTLPSSSPASIAKKTVQSKRLEVLRQQELALEGFTKAAVEHQRKGELLYAHYQDVDSLLRRLREARAASSWAEVKRTFKDPLLVKIDEEKAEITIELE